jgi:hypothetical protein
MMHDVASTVYEPFLTAMRYEGDFFSHKAGWLDEGAHNSATQIFRPVDPPLHDWLLFTPGNTLAPPAKILPLSLARCLALTTEMVSHNDQHKQRIGE